MRSAPGRRPACPQGSRHSELAANLGARWSKAPVKVLAATASFCAREVPCQLRQPGPLAGLRRGRQFRDLEFHQYACSRGGIDGSVPKRGRMVKDSQSNPKARSTIVSNKIEADARRHRRRRPAIVHHVRGQRDALISAWRRGRLTPSDGGRTRRVEPVDLPSGGSRTSRAGFRRVGHFSRDQQIIGGLFPDDGDGDARAQAGGFPPVLEKLGYKLTEFRPLSETSATISPEITAFKRDNTRL